MIDPLTSAATIAASGLDAQSMRLRVIAENIANAQATGQTPGSDPYRRKTVVLNSSFDQALGAASVEVRDVSVDNSPFTITHDPGNPAADSEGNVKLPNVNPLVEMADLREASRGYEAGLEMVKAARSMSSMLLDLLRNGS
jgi:flagellar basal-body rod protein FlgC